MTLRPPAQGFTLLEVLFVLAILGLIFVIAMGGVINWVHSTQLREAAIQVESDLERVRSSSLRFNRDTQFRVVTSTSYQMTVNGQSSVINLANATLGPVGATISYSAPHSLLSTPPLSLRLAVGRKSRTVRTIGLTGKVVIDASN
ncbi:prepilin-type N-terminal cleavage/methylation domain-containing protein [Deinococcus deserti]|uniref:Putative pilus assembly protein n=1 Tax=Deinococcus deserti (strain DSM 17065 / CIP 109153 / LMG 22923 / VCD115) TaxID=546414 RepID=C1CXY7_DEIDV|nr:prepilin-type N-terminal cleavage/methylation domain-containing protein [Deinococcus deserti]ACO46943.1 putative pilus assembly protein [Deinococcus deserti VCD115]